MITQQKKKLKLEAVPYFLLHSLCTGPTYVTIKLCWSGQGGVENKGVRIKARGKMSSSWEFCISLTVDCRTGWSGGTGQPTHSIHYTQ